MDTSKKKRTKKSVDAETQQAWIDLVHGGSCCAFDDPKKDEKEKFLKKLKNQ